MALRCKLRRSASEFALAGFLFLLSGQVWAEHVLSRRFKLPKASASKIMFGKSPSSPFDLDQQRLHFAPNANGGYDVSALAFSFETNFGTNLNAGDDTNHRISFAQGFSFPFFGTVWDHVWIRSNANVTFGNTGNPDFYDQTDFLLELPMIAALFVDLNPAMSGRVLYRQAADRFVITWDRITEFDNTNSNTVQLALFPDGSFDIVYNGVAILVPISGQEMIVGYNSGRSGIKYVNVDFSNLPIAGSNAAALYESFPSFTLFQGPESGSIAAGASISTDGFALPETIGAQGPKPRMREMSRHSFRLIKSSAQVVAPTAPAGSNEFIDPSAIIRSQQQANAPLQLSSFEGIPFSGFIPPDPHMAAGENHVMGTVNSQFAIYEKTGTMLKLIDADAWFASVLPGVSPGDPQILYDHHAGRWIMIWHNAVSTPSQYAMFLSVSDDDNPLGTWYNWRLPGGQLGSTPTELFNDYPKIGIDDEACYVTDNMGAFVRLRIIPKAQLYNNSAGPVTWTDFWNLRNPDLLLVPCFTVVPAVTFGTPGTEYLINDSPLENGTFMTLWSLSDPVGNPTLAAVNVPVTETLGAPSNADQLGGSRILIEVGGRRVRNAVYMNGSLWTAHSIAGGSDRAFAFARYVRIEVNTATAVEDFAMGADNFWYYYPAIHPDANGNLFMHFTRSGLTEYAGARYTGRLATDPPGLQASAILTAGEGNYVADFGSGRNRWGDYLGIALDPVDGSKVWILGEYAATGNSWHTRFGQLSFTPISGRHIRLDPQSVAFANLDVGQSSAPVSITSSNVGSEVLTISAIATSSPSFVLSGLPTLPAALSSFRELQFSVRFSPVEGGALSDTIRIHTDDPAAPVATIPLSGRAFGTATFSGVVKDSLNDTPLQASLDFFVSGEATPITTTNTNPDGSYSVVVREGTYDVAVAPEFPYPSASLLNVQHALSGTQRDIRLSPAVVALVEDDSTEVSNTIIADLLRGLGYEYAVWNTSAQGGSVPSDKLRILTPPAILFWLTGQATTNSLTPAERTTIIGHLDGGYPLVLTGDNIAQTAPANDELMENYLGVRFNSNYSQAILRGFTGDPIGNGLTTGASGASKDQLQLVASPRSRVNKVFHYGSVAADSARLAAVRAEEPSTRWRAAFFGFRLEVASAINRRTIVERTLNWVKESSVGVDEPATEAPPVALRLRQNYPNPFNPTTTISYELLKTEFVTIKIYDVLGHEVATLVNGKKSAGRHSVTFDGGGLTDGVYLYRLEAEGVSETRKLVLLK